MTSEMRRKQILSSKGKQKSSPRTDPSIPLERLFKLFDCQGSASEGNTTSTEALQCQSCENIVPCGGFCRECKVDGACLCKHCLQPIKKTRTEGLGEKARTIRGGRCGKCRVVVYCDSACQRADWKQHKKQCRLRPAKDISK